MELTERFWRRKALCNLKKNIQCANIRIYPHSYFHVICISHTCTRIIYQRIRTHWMMYTRTIIFNVTDYLSHLVLTRKSQDGFSVKQLHIFVSPCTHQEISAWVLCQEGPHVCLTLYSSEKPRLESLWSMSTWSMNSSRGTGLVTCRHIQTIKHNIFVVIVNTNVMSSNNK